MYRVNQHGIGSVEIDTALGIGCEPEIGMYLSLYRGHSAKPVFLLRNHISVGFITIDNQIAFCRNCHIGEFITLTEFYLLTYTVTLKRNRRRARVI